MPFKIQRVPRGLLNLLNINGPQSPPELEDRVRSVVDLLQMYGLSQERVEGNNNAALAEGTDMATGAPLPNWALLYECSLTVIKTATMTALRGNLWVRIAGLASQEYSLAAEEMGPFGATETGSCTMVWTAPYPRLLAPGTLIGCRVQILGTDATCNAVIGAHLGVLG